MHRLLVAYSTPPDPQAFMDYYVTKHLPLASTLPGLLGSRYLQPKALGPGAAEYFLLYEGDFADEAAMLAALTSPIGERVAADVPNYSPNGATLMHYDVPGG